MIGTTVLHYKIIEKLGGGGMGVVYKAQDLKLDRAVALKFLPPELTLDPDAKERFVHEAKAASSLQHHNICTIHDIDQTADGQMFIVMDLYEGETLKSRIAKGKLKIEEATDIAIQIAQGLAEAHQNGIVHRDVKPANILITKSGVVKIVDFGLAKLSGATKVTKSGSTLGTVAYMAPEQLQGSDVDARADIFSLGVVLYEMVTGKTPFRGDHEAALMYSIVNQDPDPLQKYLPDAPSEFLDVLDRALEKEPDDRYQSVHDMVIDLHKLEKRTSRVSRATPVLPHGDSRAASLREPTQTFQRGKAGPRKARWVVASVIAIIICVMGWLLFRQEPRRPAFRAGRTSQLTSEPGVEIDPALSPDGKMIAYSSYLKGTLRVHVKQLTGAHTICLTDKMPGYQRFPQWSRDGSEIAFYSVLSNARYLIAKFDLFSVTRDVVPSLGGAPRRIATGVWSCDGKRTAFTWEDTIYTEVIDEGKREKLAVIFDPNLLAWAPDGSMIAFVSGNHYYILSEFLGNIAPSSICVATVPGGVVTQITDKKSLNTSPAWASDGRHLFFVSNCDGTRDIYCVAISRTGQSEGKPERLTTGLNAYTISLSVDSKTLAYSVLTYSGNIWSIRIPEGKPVPLSEATQVTTGNQVIETLGISPDGQWLAYDCNREGNQHIFKVLLKGGEPIQLTRNPSDDFYPNWSPDGRMIAFHSIRAGNRDIFVMLNDGTQLQQITHDTTQKFCPGWSPDGNQIAFYSDRSGRQEIYVVSKISGSSKWGAPRQISFEGGVYPRWSPDGFWIAYGGNGLRVVSPKGGSPRVLVSADDSTKIPHPQFPEWSPDSRTVYYKAVDESQRSSYWAVSLNGGKPRLLVKFDDPSRQPGLGFAVDGKHLFFTISKYESDISKMELIKEE